MNTSGITRLMTATVIALTFTGGPVLAGPSSAVADADEHEGKKVALFFGNSIAGAVLGGPIGMFAGAITGVWLGERVGQSYELEGVTQAMEKTLAAETELTADLRMQLAAVDRQNTQLQQLAADSLEFQVMFRTGHSKLDVAGEERIARVARFLVRQPSLQIRLSGYADPRGDDAFNNALTRQRVASIANLLKNNGLPGSRITTTAYGDSQSVAADGDYDAYALERRVKIELMPPRDESSVADAR
ncbi:MAG: OmpA family protein [Gammaproteobacteria bacterium]|nr:OmpA family protein [Gammaproteobacteria bacterium]MDP7418902.1 OmpA family protein [Gammaproteobacteria bacterium]